MSQHEITRRRFLQTTGAVVGASVLSHETLANRLVKDEKIDHVAIYPAIGVARVGNSEAADEAGYFVGPEVVEPLLHPTTPVRRGRPIAPPIPAIESRDVRGALRRQAARFRIYAFNKKGEVLKELTAADAQIEWRTHLVNRKADWFQFTAALDIDECKTFSNVRRNAEVPETKRSELVIDPGKATTISGRSQSGSAYHFGGAFQGSPVYLGELRTDKEGRLLVLGGRGKAASPGDAPIYDPERPDTFNNADGWWDDTSDGSVDATVTVNGQRFEAKGSWVVVGPPNYAPHVIGWRTLYDLLVHTYLSDKKGDSNPEIKKFREEYPKTTVFERDVLPLLQRLSNLQWVNQRFAENFGKGTDWDFADPAFVQRLADKNETELRKKVFNKFRIPGSADAKNRKGWPMFYGDSYGSTPVADAPNNAFQVPKQFIDHLTQWRDGKFEVKKPATERPYTRLEEVPLVDQPEMLTRSALSYCLADAFHPGCEVTWPMRHASLYSEPFRIRRRSAEETGADETAEFVDQLTPAIALAAGGPIYGQRPGDLTKWMALPWHGDTAYCRSGYEPLFDHYLLTFWPARVPNQVLTEADYQEIRRLSELEQNLRTQGRKLSPDQEKARSEAFQRRESWFRHLINDPPDQMKQVVAEPHLLGTIEAMPGLIGHAQIPPIVFVEKLPPVTSLESAPKSFATRAAPAPASPEDEPYRKAGFESKEQWEKFVNIRMRFRPTPPQP